MNIFFLLACLTKAQMNIKNINNYYFPTIFGPIVVTVPAPIVNTISFGITLSLMYFAISSKSDI